MAKYQTCFLYTLIFFPTLLFFSSDALPVLSCVFPHLFLSFVLSFAAVFCICDYQWPGFFWLWLVSCSHAASIARTALFSSRSKVRAAQGGPASPWAEWGSAGLARHPSEGPAEGWRVRYKHAACGPRGWQKALAFDTRVFVFAWTRAAFFAHYNFIKMLNYLLIYYPFAIANPNDYFFCARLYYT